MMRVKNDCAHRRRRKVDRMRDEGKRCGRNTGGTLTVNSSPELSSLIEIRYPPNLQWNQINQLATYAHDLYHQHTVCTLHVQY